MKRKPILNFFDISSDVEELPENELFVLKGGYSDVAWENDIDPVDVPPPNSGGDNSGDGDGGDANEWYNDNEGSGDPGWDSGSNEGANIGDENWGVSIFDPFMRDENGIIYTHLGELTHNNDYPGVTLILEKVALQLKNGKEVVAYKTAMVYDHATKENREPTASEKANCFGFAVADGDFWFYDDRFTPSDEFTSFDNILLNFFQETSQAEAAIAVVFLDDFAYHAGVVNGDGFISKGGVGDVYKTDNEFDFRNGDKQNGAYLQGDVKYYTYKK